MLYIYTSETCPKCYVLKIRLKERGCSYVERSADRLKNPEDDIDKIALMESAMQKSELPVMVEWKEK